MYHLFLRLHLYNQNTIFSYPLFVAFLFEKSDAICILDNNTWIYYTCTGQKQIILLKTEIVPTVTFLQKYITILKKIQMNYTLC